MASAYDPNISMACMTQLTREIFEGKKTPSRNMHNRKPFRTKAQRTEARRDAYKAKDGTHRSDAPVSYHPAPRKGAS